jgi:RNA polymerase sigma factor (TIGR02999 family)
MPHATQNLNQLPPDSSPAAAELLPQLYDELRRLAAAKLSRERPGQTLQATALVHEAWLRLGRSSAHPWNGSRHFFYAAAEAMRRILIENARRKRSVRHGGGLERVNAADLQLPSPMRADELLALDEALGELAREDPDAARLVELRFFAGLGHQEAAEVLGISRRTADGLWAYARSWLFAALQADAAKPGGNSGN